MTYKVEYYLKTMCSLTLTSSFRARRHAARGIPRMEPLTTVTIPASVAVMKSGVFAGCKNLQTIYCEAAEQPSGWYSTWLDNCSAQVVWNYNVGAQA